MGKCYKCRKAKTCETKCNIVGVYDGYLQETNESAGRFRTLITFNEDGTIRLDTNKQSVGNATLTSVETSHGVWKCKNGFIFVNVYALGSTDGNAPDNQIHKSAFKIELDCCGEIKNIGNGFAAGSGCQGFFTYGNDSKNTILTPVPSLIPIQVTPFLLFKLEADCREPFCGNYP